MRLRTTLGPPRLLFCSPDAERTGPPRYLLGLLRWLRANQDLTLEVVLGAGGPLVDDFAALAPLSVLQNGPGRLRSRPAPDLVYLNAIAAARVYRQLPHWGAPVIGHVHELSLGIEHRATPNDMEVFRSASRVLAVSGAVIDELSHHHGFRRDEIGLQPGFVAGGSPPPATRVGTRAALGVPDGAVVVGCSGTLDWRKAPDLFLRVLDGLQRTDTGPPVHGLWVGGGPTSDLADSFGRDRGRVPHPEQVHHVQATADPLSWFAAMDVFVLTAREDAFPLVCIEAASLGIPVVCFDNGGAAELVTEAGCGAVVAYPDLGLMVAEVERLVRDAELRLQSGERGRRFVSDTYTADVVGPHLWDEIDALLRR